MRRPERACTAAQPSATTTENDQPCQAGGGFRRCATLDHDGATVEDSPHFHPLLEPRTPAAEALVLNRTLACPDPRSSPAPGAKNALVTTGAVISAASRSEQRLRGGRPQLEQGGTSGVKIPCRRIDPPIEAPPTPARPHRPVPCTAASSDVTGSQPQGGGCRPAPGALRRARRRDDRGSSPATGLGARARRAQARRVGPTET